MDTAKEKIYYYARVSSKNQNLNRQISLFQGMGGILNETIIMDKESGKDFNREGYSYLKKCLLRPGDTLVVKELDRLGRNKKEVKEELVYYKTQKIQVRILDLPTTMTEIQTGQEWILEMMNNVLIEVLSSFAEQEREKITSRQREGMAAMPLVGGKKYSTRTGRPIGRPPADLPEWNIYYDKWIKKEITAVECMRRMHISRTLFYNLVKKEKKFPSQDTELK